MTSLSTEELLELFVVREAMEGMASRCAAINASDENIVRLGKLLSQHEKDPESKAVAATSRVEAILIFISRSRKQVKTLKSIHL